MHFAVQNYIKKMTYTRVYDTFLFFFLFFYSQGIMLESDSDCMSLR